MLKIPVCSLTPLPRIVFLRPESEKGRGGGGGGGEKTMIFDDDDDDCVYRV